MGNRSKHTHFGEAVARSLWDDFIAHATHSLSHEKFYLIEEFKAHFGMAEGSLSCIGQSLSNIDAAAADDDDGFSCSKAIMHAKRTIIDQTLWRLPNTPVSIADQWLDWTQSVCLWPVCEVVESSHNLGWYYDTPTARALQVTLVLEIQQKLLPLLWQTHRTTFVNRSSGIHNCQRILDRSISDHS